MDYWNWYQERLAMERSWQELVWQSEELGFYGDIFIEGLGLSEYKRKRNQQLSSLSEGMGPTAQAEPEA